MTESLDVQLDLQAYGTDWRRIWGWTREIGIDWRRICGLGETGTN